MNRPHANFIWLSDAIYLALLFLDTMSLLIKSMHKKDLDTFTIEKVHSFQEIKYSLHDMMKSMASLPEKNVCLMKSVFTCCGYVNTIVFLNY
ncbi:uncharacterized protein B0P05DRAFT_543670 [Gilbertella persicaria]|uniref:uncharacterized protein n=1 Tax=Gilbertella persicaria TaxID=101096 RepID=UPI00221F42D2|nr:uncharacterized protein B0P05DRAFT_543670 [Gilbertella persicaria]KAI8077996.1 hypothetical protein B0P05DRAFT_543670 [Gilbertella persicaria]